MNTVNGIKEWTALIEPIPKSAVPLEFVKQIVFYYPDGNEYVLNIDELIIPDDELGMNESMHNILQNWIDANHIKAKKASMILDIKKVRKFIEPITSEFLKSYFE